MPVDDSTHDDVAGADTAGRKTIIAEVTRECNLSCSFCPTDAWINSRCDGCRRYPRSAERNTELSVDDWKQVLHDAVRIGYSSLEIRGGEALLRPRLVLDLLNDAECIGMEQARVWTNGVLLEQAYVDELIGLNIPVTLTVQVVSADPTEHDRITGSRGTFDRMVENIAYAVASRVALEIVTPITQSNQHHKNDVYETFRGLGISRFIFQPTILHVLDVSDPRPHRLMVNWHGDVLLQPCSRWQKLGDVKEDNLGDILRARQGGGVEPNPGSSGGEGHA